VLVTPFVLQVVPMVASRSARNEASVGALIRLIASFLLLSVGALTILATMGDRIVALAFGGGFAATAELVVPHAAGALLGYVGLVLAQGLAALGHFGFLWLYGAVAVLHVGAFFALGDSTLSVVIVTLAARAATLVAVLVSWAVVARGAQR